MNNNSIFIIFGIIICFLSSCTTKVKPAFSNEEQKQLNFYPTKDLKPWQDVNVKLFPPRIRSKSGVSLSKMEESENGIIWKAYLGSLFLECTAVTSDNIMDLSLTISNKGKSDELISVRYPEVYYHFANESTLRVLDPTFGGVLEQKKPYPMVDVTYPGLASFCATLVAGKDKALGIAIRNKEQRSAHIRHLPASPSGQMSIELDRILVPAGKSIELPSAYIASGSDWSEVLLPYRDWFQATFPPKMNIPEWYESGEYSLTHTVHCIVPYYPPTAAAGIWVFDPTFKVRTFEDVKKDVDRGVFQAANRNSKPLFYLFGWWEMMESFQGVHMFDAVCGDYTEGHQLAKEAIQYIHSKEGRVFLYANFISAGEESRLFKEQPGLFARNEDGEAVRNASYPMYLFCASAPGIREYWDDVLKYILIEMNADGVFLDQLGGGSPSPKCTDPSHKHKHPDSYGEQYLALVEYVSKKAKELKPDALVCCELIDDVRSQYIDLVQGFGYARPKEMTFSSGEQAAHTPPHEYMVFLKYINPYANMFPGSSDNVALGSPGYPSDTIYTKYKDQFKSGLQPLKTDPVGAMAYLYGPVNGEAVLAVKAWDDINNVKVTLPDNFIPVNGGTDLATKIDDKIVAVEAGKRSKYYVLKSLTN
jgi:hypothetical protein